MCLGKLHFKFCQSQCALKVVFTLKSIVTYFLATLGPFLGTLKLSNLADFLLEHYRHSKVQHIKFHDPTSSKSG